MTDLATTSDQDPYDDIEQAVMQTERGRWFLKEFAQRNRNADTERLLDAIEKLGHAGGGGDSEAQSRLNMLRRELQEMSASIEQTRSEIAAIKPAEDGDNRIMAATGELDAIVTATERATSDILSAAERLQDIGEKLRADGADADLCDEIDTHATGIFMACSFQDITGQRTTKVVQVLHYLEQRVNSMVQIWGMVENQDAAAVPDIKDADTRPDNHLLNGPQMDGEGVDQGDIDAMMDDISFDEPGTADTSEAPDAEDESDDIEFEAVAAQEPEVSAEPEKAATEEPAAEEPPAAAAKEEPDQTDIDAMFD